jgi:hypothetical protein
MTEPPPLEGLDALLAEARRYAGFLAKLEARRSETSPALYARLHAEYAARLAELQGLAAAEAEALVAGIAADEEAVLEADRRLVEVREACAEGMVRAAVGELDPRTWAQRLEALNAEIASITLAREALMASLAQRRGVLAAMRGPTATPARMSLVDEPMASPAAPPAGPETAPAMVPEVAPQVVAPTTVPPAAPILERVQPAAQGEGGEGKSLRCLACGTMNVPTEWYCERCGGELAAE